MGRYNSLVSVTVCIVVTILAGTDALHWNPRLDDIVCDSTTTKVIPPHYYKYNAAGWCSPAVDEVFNDVYNLAYRQECQRWMDGELPERVAGTQLVYCYEFPNATVMYDVGVCCLGVIPNDTIRCFTGQAAEIWSTSSNSAYYTGSLNYRINYENNLTTCENNEVCETRSTFYGSYGTIRNVTLTKGCYKKNDCLSVNDSCVNCAVETPACASCCESAFCNYNYQYYQLRPAGCGYPCDSAPCQNGGICSNLYNSTSGQYYAFKCYCKIQWNGTVCDEMRSTCTGNNPCQNNGTCYDYSDISPGNYRCECRQPFVGDVCNMQQNLTCPSGPYKSFSASYSGRTCNQITWSSSGNPDYYISEHYYTYVKTMCLVDGPEAAFKIDFETKTCSRGDTYAWVTYHSCCSNRTLCQLNDPCLNGGTCYDWTNNTFGEFRCDCAAPYVGDRCEINSNLTCSATDYLYLKDTPAYTYETNAGLWQCTPQARDADGKPANIYSDVIKDQCIPEKRRPSDGHQFVQGVDGQIKPDQVQFEMQYCDYGDGFSRCKYHMCCPGCVSSPCQNGGYCIQLAYNEFVCKCTFGFNGVYCENRLSVCKVSGDPHYRTFDTKQYDYQGICKHNLASVCSEDPDVKKFEVFGRNENRDGVNSVSYPWYVEIVYNGLVVRLTGTGSTTGKPVEATINGTVVQVPYIGDFFSIGLNGDYVQYVADIGLSVDYDGDWVINVNIPGGYSGKMCGLCGDNDGNPNNDFTLPNGTYIGDQENAANLFGDSWVVDDPEQPDTSICPAPAPPGICDPAPYIARCSVLNDTDGIFASCISKLPPGAADAYVEECIMDACYTGGASICKTIEMFNEQCQSYGADISCSIWQPAVECDADSTMCPPGMTYECGVSACQPSCSDPNAPDSCALPNVDACVCQPGQLLFNGQCTSNCPVGCIDPNQQLRPIGDSWPLPGCSTATCVSCPECELGAEISVTYNCGANDVCINNTCVYNGTLAIADCGSVLALYTNDSSILPRDFSIVCYLQRATADTELLNTECQYLLQDLPRYDDAENLLLGGGNFGCWLDTSFPPNAASIDNACFDDYQHNYKLSMCSSCLAFTVCIRFP